jgi:hypothetical protein
MKRFKDLKEELFNEGGEMYPADDMTMKEIKIACYAAQNILDRLESGQMIQRWQISAIVKAKEELASVYTSLSADEDDDEMNWDDMDEEDPMYVGFEYPSMYEEVDVNKTELKAAIDAGKKKGKIASVEAVKYIRAKHGLTHTRAHDVWKNIRHELGEETELLDESIEIVEDDTSSLIQSITQDLNSYYRKPKKGEKPSANVDSVKKTKWPNIFLVKGYDRKTQIEEWSYDQKNDKVRGLVPGEKQILKLGPNNKYLVAKESDYSLALYVVTNGNAKKLAGGLREPDAYWLTDKKQSPYKIKRYSDDIDHYLHTNGNKKGAIKESVEIDEGILKSYHSIANKPWSETVKASANTVGEYKQIAKGKDFTIWTGYRGSLKQQPHYVVKDDKIVGSGMTMNAALKDAKLKDSDLTARSKFPTGSILNKGMKEATDYEVDVEGLPKMFVKANSPTEVKNNLRKVVKNPDMIRGVERVAKATLQKIFRDKASGKDDVALDEEKHPIVKEYEDLKKHDINTLRGIVKQQSRISDTSEIRTKDHAITKILRHKHGNKKVAQAFGLDEEVDLNEVSINDINKAIMAKHRENLALAKSKQDSAKIDRINKQITSMNSAVSKYVADFNKKNEEVDLDDISKKESTSYRKDR